MIQLVYISTATHPMPYSEVEAICAQSSRNNRRNEISGLLVARDDRFLQVLEGPREAIEDTFLRIVVDPRHRDLTLLSRRETETRYFGAWDMRHCWTIDEYDSAIAKLVPLIDHAPDNIRMVFNDFVARSNSTANAELPIGNRPDADRD